MTQVLQGQQNQADDEFRGLRKIHRNNMPTFKGIYDPKGARTWLSQIQKIFRVMACTEVQKMHIGHMLSEEVEDWWNNVRQRLEAVGVEITCVVFQAEFLEKYFLEDMHNKKEIEFLELKQRIMIVVKYAAKFGELVKFCQHYNNVAIKGSKCIKFKSGLRSKIMQGIGYQKIFRFHMLVSKCRIYDEDNKACSAYYKSLSEKKGRNRNRGKLYSALADKGKQKASGESKPSG